MGCMDVEMLDLKKSYKIHSNPSNSWWVDVAIINPLLLASLKTPFGFCNYIAFSLAPPPPVATIK